MATFPFSGAVAETPGYGQKHKIRFGQTWVAGEDWTIQFTSTLLGSFTLGKGNIAGQTFTCGFKLRNRMYLGFGSSFALSSVGDVTLWEEQDPGTAVVEFLSQFGDQDSVTAFAAFEGKLVVYGRKSIQIWKIDADPSQFALLQTLDNSGTRFPSTVKLVGDFDVYFLEDSGVSSIRAKSFNENAFVSDIGTAIASTIVAQLRDLEDQPCAIVEPLTKQYWLYLNGVIYVYSNYPESKIAAWSTFKPTYLSSTALVLDPASYDASGVATYTSFFSGVTYFSAFGNATSIVVDGVIHLSAAGPFAVNGGTTIVINGPALAAVTTTAYAASTSFIPEKFVVYNGLVYNRTLDDSLIMLYDVDSFDYTVVTAELPWLDLDAPSMEKSFYAIDVAMEGSWIIKTGTNPKTTSYVTAVNRGSEVLPDMSNDSTSVGRRYPISGNGDFVKVLAQTNPYAKTAKLGKVSILYKTSREK